MTLSSLRPFRGLLLLLVLAGVLALPAHAQSQGASDNSDDDASGDPPPVMQAGGWGLQFQFDGLDEFGLDDFQGSAISARYHFSSTNALRAGVSLNGDSFNEEITRPSGVTTEEDRSSQDVEVRGQYVRYYRPAEDVYLFAGGGPAIGFGSDSIERQNSESNEPRRFDRTSFSFGLDGVLGVEWFVHPNISLSAEYSLGADVTSIDAEETRTDSRTTESSTTAYRFGGQSVLVGVTVSFGP